MEKRRSDPMSCEFEARVSTMIDGALSPEEAAEMRDHLADCETCRRLEQDLAHLSRAIRSYPAPACTSGDEALASILGSRPAGFWRRRVSVPLPAAVAAALAVTLLGAWAARSSMSAPDPQAASVETTSKERVDVKVSGFDRFDRGQRALLYKVRRDDLHQ